MILALSTIAAQLWSTIAAQLWSALYELILLKIGLMWNSEFMIVCKDVSGGHKCSLVHSHVLLSAYRVRSVN